MYCREHGTCNKRIGRGRVTRDTRIFPAVYHSIVRVVASFTIYRPPEYSATPDDEGRTDVVKFSEGIRVYRLTVYLHVPRTLVETGTVFIFISRIDRSLLSQFIINDLGDLYGYYFSLFVTTIFTTALKFIYR